MGRPTTTLSAAQRRQLDRVARKGERLTKARAALELAHDEVRQAAVDALAAGIPLLRVAQSAGVSRPLIYKWLDE
jgi:hypothetical protein